jgi:ABC-2 type transport system permease protein
MKTNIFQHEFKMSLRSVIIWSVSITLLMLVYLSLFSSFAKDAELLDEMMDKFPKELLMAFGMADIDLASVLGYFALTFLFSQICLAIQASNYGFSLVSIEERELTADFLLAKPVGRSTILTSKLLSAISGMTLTNIVVWIISYIGITVFGQGKEYDRVPLLLLLLSIVIFQLFFLSVGLVISLLVKRVRSVTPYSMALVFGMYILNAFGNMIGEDSLEVISPFKQFEPNYIVTHAAYNLPLVLLSLAVIIVSITASYVLYAKRNISAPV